MNRRLPKRWLEGLAIGMAMSTLAFGAVMTESELSAIKDRAAADSDAAQAQCALLAGNVKDVCVAEAKAVEKKTKAMAEAQYKDTDKARSDAAVAAAEADYDVAKEKCGAYPGAAKESCVAAARMKYLQ